MARITPVRVRIEDSPDPTDPGVWERFLRAFNTLSEQTTTALSKGLKLTENAHAATKTIDITAAATMAVQFRNDLGTRPLGVLVMESVDISAAATVPAALGGVAWKTSGDQIVVSGVAGMTVGNKYRITFLLLGG